MLKAEYQGNAGFLQRDSVGHKGYAEAQSTDRREGKERDGASGLLEAILDRDNLNRAYKRVKRNRGAAGIDGMTVEEALPWLKERRKELFAEYPGWKLYAWAGTAEGNPETGWRRAKAGNPHGSRPCDSAGNRAEAAKHLGAAVFRQQLRRRFRMYIWKQWKKPRTKVANLRKLGIPADKAYQWGNSRRGYWRIAGSPVLKCSITNERLAAAGYFGILNYYDSLHLCG